MSKCKYTITGCDTLGEFPHSAGVPLLRAQLQANHSGPVHGVGIESGASVPYGLPQNGKGTIEIS